MQLPISSIIINERQRLDLGDLSDLNTMADSQVGQILPIVVDNANNLLDGRRRLAKATALGWTHIEVHVRQRDDNAYTKQLIELYADIGRKDRTWQERCLAFLKLHTMNPSLTCRQLATIMKCGVSHVGEVLNIARELYNTKSPATEEDKELWATSSVYDAAKLLILRQARVLEVEMNRRAKVQKGTLLTSERIERVVSGGHLPQAKELLDRLIESDKSLPSSSLSGTLLVDDFDAPPISAHDPWLKEFRNKLDGKPFDAETLFLYEPLYQRVAAYNIATKLPKPLALSTDKDFFYGFWFLGGGNVSDFYGSYSRVYFDNIMLLFRGAQKPLHLFAGSLPPSDKYIRVGLDPTGKYKYEIECNAEQLDSNIAVRTYAPDVIFADPPYSIEDMEHYQNEHLVNRAKVVSACANVLQPGGFLVWLDQVLPVFSNAELKWVGCISYIRSTANRFRCVSVFQKPLCPVTGQDEKNEETQNVTADDATADDATADDVDDADADAADADAVASIGEDDYARDHKLNPPV